MLETFPCASRKHDATFIQTFKGDRAARKLDSTFVQTLKGDPETIGQDMLFTHGGAQIGFDVNSLTVTAVRLNRGSTYETGTLTYPYFSLFGLQSALAIF